MIKINPLYSSIIVAVLTALAMPAHAQQQNRPNTSTAPAPTVNPVPSYGSNAKINYVRTWEAVAPITDAALMISLSKQDVKQTTQYVDGLGRPLQTVSRQITRQGMDMVAPVVYDEFGREAYKYLPYVSTANDGLFKTDPFNEQKTFMKGQYSDEQVYYSKIDYEASPLNRVLKTMAPGNSWAGTGTGVTTDYQVNTTLDAVRVWSITNSDLAYGDDKDVNTNIPTTAGTYDAGTLYKTVNRDEAGHAVVEYKDKEGQVVLKKVQVADNIATDFSGYDGFLCTYYVYDDFNQLRFVIPPKAVNQLRENSSWQFTANIINELCFRYEYDARKRMTAKKVPGAGWVYMIYDVADRLVFTQDANLRKTNQWMTTLYDGLNRPVMTGVMTFNSTPSGLQDKVNKQTGEIQVPSGLASDLVLPMSGQTVPVTGSWQAYNSITLNEGFESGAEFTAEVFGGAGGNVNESTVEGMTVNKSPLPQDATFIALTKTYYDGYGWTSTSYKKEYGAKLDAGTDASKGYNLHPVNVPEKESTETTGLVTGTKIRVITDPANLAAGAWLTTVTYYDDRNRVIQVYAETQKGHDVVTNRYDFTGKVICSYLDHINTGGAPAYVHVKTNYEYDHAGRLMEVWKTIDDDASKKALIAKNSYDELGQLTTKQLGRKKDDNGAYTNDPLETLTYNYNIRGWMTGINKDYANGTPATAAPGEGPWFGMELSYDKGFTKSQYNGNIAGTKWRSRGDDQRRAYGYSYDGANRLMGADFTQFDGTDYVNNDIVKFDMVMGNGTDPSSAYDENGNIKAMKQWGLTLNNSPVIDDLTYSYFNGGNKLMTVADASAPPAGVAKGWGLGDFTDKNTTGNDYGYDENGNMVTDLNKGMKGTADIDLKTGGAITYNHLNLPAQITVTDDNGTKKGTIKYIYDAAGNKLQKITEEDNASVNYNGQNYTSKITTTTTYIGGLVYESKSYEKSDVSAMGYTDKLQFLGQEEGRIRYIAATEKVAAHFEYDYFIKDHLGNVRMVLTEEKTPKTYTATMETGTGNATRATENQIFYNLDASSYLTKDVPGGYPPDGSLTNPNDNVARVNGSDQKKGPAIVLKVMAGDVIDVGVNSFYRSHSANEQTSSVLENILASLAQGIVQTNGDVKGSVSALSDVNTSPLVNPLSLFREDHNTDIPNKPKAYLNWIFLNEQFKYDGTISNALPVEDHDQMKRLAYSGIEIPKNGYLYIYLSNETQNWDVFFDDFSVVQHPGALLEETHYYPFGLAMAGISSKTVGSLINRKKFNGIEQTTDLDLNQYDAFYRNLDPQTGRWWQIDPRIDQMEMWSPFASNYDNPVLYNDPKGDCPACVIALEELVETGVTIYRAYQTAKTIESATNALSQANSVPEPVNMVITTDALGQTTVVKQDNYLSFLVGREKTQALIKKQEEEGKTEDAKGGTYVLKDPKTGKVMRNGRTVDLERREKEHARGEETAGLEFEVDVRTDDKKVQRGAEHLTHERHKPPLNKIKPIRDNNPRKDDYINAAVEFIKKLAEKKKG